MLVKIIKNGTESEWFPLTKKRHRALLIDEPDTVLVHIESLYPKSPESGQVVPLNFPCFNLLAREFILEENRQKKQDARHRDRRAMEDIDPNENKALARSVDDELLRLELWAAMEKSSACLTAPQRRRIRMYVEEGLSLSEIARREGVSYKVIGRSIWAGLKKIKNILEAWV